MNNMHRYKKTISELKAITALFLLMLLNMPANGAVKRGVLRLRATMFISTFL